MKAGETLNIVQKLNLTKPYDVVRFRLSNGINTITKDLTEDSGGVFVIPLYQEDTHKLEGRVSIEAEVDFEDKSVRYSNFNDIYLNKTLGYDPVENNQPSDDDGVDLIMESIEQGVAVVISPESAEELITRVTELYQQTKEISEHAEEVAQSVRDDADEGKFNGKDGVDGKDGRDGVDGKDGSDGKDGRDGVDGKDGQDGADGFSPTVTVKTQTNTDYVLEITDKNGSYDTPNLQGQKGDKGDRGDGTVTDTAKGSSISLTDSAESPLDAISIMGKSTQNGTPTIDNPVPIVDITTEQIEVTDGTQTQQAELTRTLRGIPVASGGNYTDNNNQQWICDTIERYKDGTGKYIQRVGVLVFNGSENWVDYSTIYDIVRYRTYTPDTSRSEPKSLFSVSNDLRSAGQQVNTYDNSYFVTGGYLFFSPTSNGQRLNAEQFKTYLASNNATLEYVLDEYIETPLTAEELAELDLDTYYPSTTITANTDVVVEYVVDVGTALLVKQDKTTISTDTTSTTVSLTLADNHEYRYTQELTSLTLTMPNGDFISSIVFASGSTPTSMTYDSSIKWSGDDVTSNAFVPVADKTYNVIFWYDGLNINAVTRGV